MDAAGLNSKGLGMDAESPVIAETVAGDARDSVALEESRG